MTRWLRLLTAELPLLRNLPNLRDRPLPRVEARIGPSVPGWTLRAASALTAATMLALATRPMAAGLAWTLVGIAALVTATLPAAAHGVVVVSGLLIAGGGQGPFDPIVFALIPLAYATVRLAWWSERAELTARVELAALARGLPRALVLTLGTAGFGVIVLLLTGRPNPVVLLAGGAALVALVWLLLFRSR